MQATLTAIHKMFDDAILWPPENGFSGFNLQGHRGFVPSVIPVMTSIWTSCFNTSIRIQDNW